ncbi:MAG TPA: NAD(P)H-dependent oxidoreductase [Rhodothermales bacterium]|nr:NADPH:quinone reductase [Bacteroidota bacterium]HRK75101.1 NAD(P)H-dependent oxidoreductase [Rhodothermales bacterium]HRR08259.1 NAD(P)H-dependent oxidoreductase [Rhodothermales bacterium]
MKNILIIQGNPKKSSFSDAIAAAYRKGAEKSGATVQQITLHSLHFDLDLEVGYSSHKDLEADLVAAQATIQWAEHVVWIYPIWWGFMPALLKGFIDRVMLPGFAFNYRKDNPMWDRHLKGKTARIITTMDTPGWYDWLMYRSAGQTIMKRAILGFCGFGPIYTTSISSMRHLSVASKEKWLRKIEDTGALIR